jgi:putative two-component system response regulator
VKVSKVLIVDDEQSIRTTLRAFLQHEGYKVEVAKDAESAQELLVCGDFDVVVSDIVLPRVTGLALLHLIRQTAPGVQVIMMTGEPTVDSAAEAVRVGASDYLTKPVGKNAILRSVATAAKMKRVEDERRRLAEENVAYQHDLERLVHERTRKLEETLQNWKDVTEGTILAMASAVESRDPYTAGHQQRVARLAQAIAREMGHSDSGISAVYYAGLIHDLGKISVPAEILSNPGKLCEEAMGLVRKHPQSGYRILEKIKFPWPIAQIILEHHERLDGSGYPQGLSGEQITKEARILAVADVVEAMASHRPYRPALGIEAALEEIQKGRRVKYDAEVVDACVRLFKENKFAFEDRPVA